MVILMSQLSLLSYFYVGLVESFTDYNFPVFYHIPLSFKSTPWAYWIVLITFYYSSYISGNLPTQCDMIITGMMSMLSKEFKILSNALIRSLDDIDFEDYTESLQAVKVNLVKLAAHHQELLS